MHSSRGSRHACEWCAYSITVIAVHGPLLWPSSAGRNRVDGSGNERPAWRGAVPAAAARADRAAPDRTTRPLSPLLAAHRPLREIDRKFDPVVQKDYCAMQAVAAR